MSWAEAKHAPVLDVSERPRIGPYYVLSADDVERAQDLDVRDEKLNLPIWSIGRALRDMAFDRDGVTYAIPRGRILASLHTDLYEGGVRFKCLWLR